MYGSQEFFLFDGEGNGALEDIEFTANKSCPDEPGCETSMPQAGIQYPSHSSKALESGHSRVVCPTFSTLAPLSAPKSKEVIHVLVVLMMILITDFLMF